MVSGAPACTLQKCCNTGHMSAHTRNWELTEAILEQNPVLNHLMHKALHVTGHSSKHNASTHRDTCLIHASALVQVYYPPYACGLGEDMRLGRVCGHITAG
jgi:hypothetical protein